MNCEFLVVVEDVEDCDFKNEVIEVWKKEYWVFLEEQVNIQVFVEYWEYIECMEKCVIRVYEIYIVCIMIMFWYGFVLDECDWIVVV